MKKIMSIAAIALMMAGSMAFACDSCGCKDKAKKEAKKESSLLAQLKHEFIV